MKRFIFDANAWFNIMHRSRNHLHIQHTIDELVSQEKIEVVYSMSNFAEMAPEWGFDKERADSFLINRILNWTQNKILLAASDIAQNEKQEKTDLPEGYPYYSSIAELSINMCEVHQEVRNDKRIALRQISKYYKDFASHFRCRELDTIIDIEQGFSEYVTMMCSAEMNCTPQKAEESIAYWFQMAALLAHVTLRLQKLLKDEDKYRKGDLYDFYLLAESEISNSDTIITDDNDLKSIIGFVGSHSHFKARAMSFSQFEETLGQLC